MSKTYRYWILTIPEYAYTPPTQLPAKLKYITGQLESAPTTGYKHWQIYVVYKSPVRITQLKKDYGPAAHAEPTRSSAASEYCQKTATRVDETRFSLGAPSINRNSKKDWQKIWNDAKEGNLENIPPDILVRSYSNIKKITSDNLKPEPIQREVEVYWGKTGTGKSHKAWAELGMDAYPKDPRTKFWDGYNGQTNVIIDEFRGAIDISHILRWLDKYPVIVEVKGSSTVLKAKKIILTSNIHPRDWYPQLDTETMEALLRRLRVVQFHGSLNNLLINK